MSLLRLIQADPSEMEKATDAYVSQVISVSTPLAIFLFGSLAQGTAHLESDIDLLIVYHSEADAKAAQKNVLTKKSPSTTPADLVFVDLAAWNQENRYSPLIEQVRAEGKLIYGSLPSKEIV